MYIKLKFPFKKKELIDVFLVILLYFFINIFQEIINLLQCVDVVMTTARYYISFLHCFIKTFLVNCSLDTGYKLIGFGCMVELKMWL